MATVCAVIAPRRSALCDSALPVTIDAVARATRRDARLAVGGLRCPQAVKPTPTSTVKRSFCFAVTVLRDGVLMRRKASSCGAVICVTDKGMKG